MRSRSLPYSLSNGIALIEILVAVAVFSIGLVGLIALHTTALRENGEALFRARVVAMGAGWMESVHTFTPELKVQQKACQFEGESADGVSGASLCEQALRDWVYTLARELPGVHVEMTRTGAQAEIARLSLRWATPGQVGAGGQSQSPQNVIVFSTVLY